MRRPSRADPTCIAILIEGSTVDCARFPDYEKFFPERVTSVAVEANLQGGAVGLAIDLRGRPSLGHLSTDGGVIDTIYATKVTL